MLFDIINTYKYGLKKVLSTMKVTFFSLQILATPAMSHIFKVGLVGVSAHTILVLGLKEASTNFKSAKSTRSTSTPCLS